MDVFNLKVTPAEFSKLSPVKRLSVLGENVQEKKDEPYLSSDYICRPMYKKGQNVLVCSQFYYGGVIKEVAKKHNEELNKMIPCYKVWYLGWVEGETEREWLFEFDMAVLENPKNFSIIEHLAAHFWNITQLEVVKKIPKTRKVGMFSLDKASIEELEQSWRAMCLSKLAQQKSVKKWTFKKFLGME